METLIWNIHAMSTWGLFGLIWTVQLLVYPQFLAVGSGEWNTYHDNHMRRITLIVAPLMLIELGTAVLLLLFPPGGVELTQVWFFGLGFTVLIWAVTVAVSVPLHGKLTDAWNQEYMRRLIRTNWLRTWGWTIRSAWVLLVSLDIMVISSA